MEQEAKDVFSSKLVMLVDDSSIDNFVNQKMIERNKFSDSVITFTKADKALKYLAEIDEQKTDVEKIPFIIFLDLNMPAISGFKFLETYEQFSSFIKSHSKIIILTSSISPLDIAKCSESESVLTFLNKPLMKSNFEEINNLVKRKLGIVNTEKQEEI